MRSPSPTTIETFSRTSGPDVGDSAAVGADDLHRLPHAAQRGHDLFDPRIAAAGIGVDLGEEPRLGTEIDQASGFTSV